VRRRSSIRTEPDDEDRKANRALHPTGAGEIMSAGG